MPRIRSIKPDLFQDERLSALSVGARLLFIGLISMADDEGRLRGSPLFIRSQIFPYEPKIDIKPWLTELERAGRIFSYEVEGETYLEIRNFKKHQKINRPSPSRLPAKQFTEASKQFSEPSLRPQNNSVSPHGGLSEASLRDMEVDLGEGSGSGKGDGSLAAEAAASERAALESFLDSVPALPKSLPQPDPVTDVFAYWAERLGHPRSLLDKDRRKLIRARLSEGGTVDDLRKAVDGVLVDIESWPDRRRFDGVEYVFENRASVEKYLDLALRGNPKPKAVSVDPRRGLQRAEDQGWEDFPTQESAK